MHVIIRRALVFIVPLLFLSLILAIFARTFSGLPEKPVRKTDERKEQETRESVVKPPNQAKLASLHEERSIKVRDSHPVIVIDPSHGGRDFGSLSKSGILESNINLIFSFRLASELRMRGFKVFLTRMDDTNPSLEERFEEARLRGALLYLSINCAYSHNSSITGLELYGFTPEFQRTEIERIKNSFYEFYEGIYEVKSQEAMVLETRVADAIKGELSLSYSSRLLRRFLKPIALPPNIPALAIFIGYLSNEREASKLSDSKHIDQLAQDLASAIERGVIRRM